MIDDASAGDGHGPWGERTGRIVAIETRISRASNFLEDVFRIVEIPDRAEDKRPHDRLCFDPKAWEISGFAGLRLHVTAVFVVGAGISPLFLGNSPIL